MRIFWFGYACHFECVSSIIYSICAPDLVSFAPRSDSVSHPPRLAQRLRGTPCPASPCEGQVCVRTLRQEKVQEAADNTSQLRAEPSKLIPFSSACTAKPADGPASNQYPVPPSQGYPWFLSFSQTAHPFHQEVLSALNKTYPPSLAPSQRLHSHQPGRSHGHL